MSRARAWLDRVNGWSPLQAVVFLWLLIGAVLLTAHWSMTAAWLLVGALGVTALTALGLVLRSKGR